MRAAPPILPEAAAVLGFEDLRGWTEDDHAAALRVFLTTCDQREGPDWAPIGAEARSTRPEDARAFFERLFRPVLIGQPPALFTGYFEPELAGSPVETPRFAWPIYRRPPELGETPWHSRAEIERGGHLRGRGLELVWLDDPVDAYFLEIQGSGRIRLPDGSILRAGFAGKNNQPYRSIGQEMIRRGILQPPEVSAEAIRAWLRRNPDQAPALLHHNPSYVFFRAIDGLDPAEGPIGTAGRPVTALRSVAVDPAFTALGTPVWIEKDGPAPLRRLTVAQDTGGAIKGAQRADIFYGTGAEAGLAAGRVKEGGRMVLLLPQSIFYSQISSGVLSDQKSSGGRFPRRTLGPWPGRIGGQTGPGLSTIRGAGE